MASGGCRTRSSMALRVPAGQGFPATVTKTSLGVALGADYRRLKASGADPSAKAYFEQRDELIPLNVQ